MGLTEQDYIDISDKQRVCDVVGILSNITPIISTVIIREEYRAVMDQVMEWQNRFFDKKYFKEE